MRQVHQWPSNFIMKFLRCRYQTRTKSRHCLGQIIRCKQACYSMCGSIPMRKLTNSKHKPVIRRDLQAAMRRASLQPKWPPLETMQCRFGTPSAAHASSLHATICPPDAQTHSCIERSRLMQVKLLQMQLAAGV